MPKTNKQVVKVSYTMDKKVAELLDAYHKESFIPKTKIIEEAVKEYIEKNTKKSSK